MVRHIFSDHVKYSDQRFSCMTCKIGFGDLSYSKDHLKEDESSESEISLEPNPNAVKLHLGSDYEKVDVPAVASKRDRSASPLPAHMA